jgi:hypothetical protein
VIALAVDDGDAQARGGKAVPGEGAGQGVFAGALADPVAPVAVVGMPGRRLLHHGPLVVGLARGSGTRLPDEVDLARADEDVVPDPALQRPHRALDVRRREAGEVHGGVEAAAGQRAVERVGGAVAMEALDTLAEGIGEGSPIEEGDGVAAGQQPPDQVVADEAVPPDDEDVQDTASVARSAAGT